MLQQLIRVAAAVGAVVAITVAGGAGAAVVSADPGGSRSPSSHSRDGAQSSRDGGHSARDGGGRRDQGPRQRDGNQGAVRGGKDRDAGDRRRGPQRTGSKDWPDDDGPTTVVAGRGGTTALAPAPEAVTASRPVAVEPATPSAVPNRPVTRVATENGGGGGGSTGQAPTPAVAPKVTVGNGRSPEFVSAPSAESSAAIEPVTLPAPAAPVLAPLLPPQAPVPVAVPSPPPPRPVEWSLPATSVTASVWGKVQPGWPVGVLFGLAGLVLAPIGGMWLGYRQAHATKKVAQLTSS